jgi:hypothetical protein
MLTSKQMAASKKARGPEFDRLFFNWNDPSLQRTRAAGQDAELFNFATDVDSVQRAEIRIMQSNAW